MFWRGYEVGLLVTSLVMTCGVTRGELLQNGGIESGMDPWHCWGFTCKVLDSGSHSGVHAIAATGRTKGYQGPSQDIQTTPGQDYKASSWVKLLNDLNGTLGQKMELEVSFTFPDNSHDYINVAMRPLVTTADGWFLLEGDFQAPPRAAKAASFYYQGPAPGVGFAVDEASVTAIASDVQWRSKTDDVIEKIRKSDINVQVTVASGLQQSDVKIQLLQTKKAFPFGCEVNSWKYVDAGQQKFRDFVHSHFNWAVLGNALKWRQFDWQNNGPGDDLYPRALNSLKGLKSAGLKLRGHNMVWSVGAFVPESVKAQCNDTSRLRTTVKDHINFVMNVTRGYLENWDVNNENLHGQYFQECLHDPDYDLDLFYMMHAADPTPELFLNDYNVVAQGAATSAYLAQAQRFKNTNPSTHVAGLGVQTHFHKDQEPNPTLLKSHLDSLAQAGLPMWVTELDVHTSNQSLRADWMEKALRATYGHPNVEGIMFWSWHGDDQTADFALAVGDDMQLTEAGRRVLDLLENQWMTDDTRTLAQAGTSFTVRGFHGDYQLRVMYQGQELTSLRKTFTLGKSAQTVQVNVQQ